MMACFAVKKKGSTKCKKTPILDWIIQNRCFYWSEWGDSNSRHPAPKAGALPTALHPVMKLWGGLGGFSQSRRATNCATPGYEVFQLWSNMWSTPIFDQLSARGKVLSAQVSQGFPGFPRAVARTRASRSQSRRATPECEAWHNTGSFWIACETAKDSSISHFHNSTMQKVFNPIDV